jgi:hypothetical protein
MVREDSAMKGQRIRIKNPRALRAKIPLCLLDVNTFLGNR